MGLLRYQLFLSHTVTFIAIWYTLLQNPDVIPDGIPDAVVRYAPLWAIVILGCYAVTSIGYSMMTFADCPEAAKEIETQVKEAKIELLKRGVEL
mmetsp:Transcript_29951/g.36491  ORF Transcript_29951/g.36491 Transcript_29951/m.36491 type:complete len:94 (-) Transcript_29951:270-551(-)|eukprot:CAMPEP_0172495128 /NCGR_PEP_ID=MMETSP1066-20121228/64160_1 /TAXON_ID=671091 /ORGANISM="Coscinodiscus wailesii, Strain CCMP2513" /LENGTH=93 /DNA_ID=CAMNT_0013266607 /DNA_START=213 /DNA_END=494 /DNA_ORIENTATION=-